MASSLYGLQYDFVYDQRNYLVVSKPDPITSADLAGIQINMLMSNPIPKLLPLEMDEVNLEVKLRYDLTSKRMLSYEFQSRKLSMSEFYRLLLQIVNVVEDSTRYMLDESNYLLHEEFVFIGQGMQDIYLTYVPMKVMEKDMHPADEMMRFLTQLVRYVDEVKGAGFQRLLAYCGLLDSYSLTGFKQELRQAMEEGQRAAAPSYNAQPLASERSIQAQAPSPPEHSNRVAIAVENSGLTANPATKSVRKRIPKPVSPLGSSEQKVKPTEALPPLSQREMIILGAVSLLLLAMVWKVYTASPSEGMLLISLGLSLLIGDLAFIYIRLWRPGRPLPSFIRKQRQETDQHLEEARHQAQAGRQQSAAMKEASAASPIFTEKPARQSASSSVVTPPAISKGASQADASYYHNLSMQTQLLSSPSQDATVLLAPQAEMDIPHLIKRDGGIPVEKIPLPGSSLTIGRNADSVDYVEDVLGVSRLHVQILLEDGQYAAKDLGTQNGTLFNGEKMVPYKQYPLNDGDVIRIIRSEFEFKIS